MSSGSLPQAAYHRAEALGSGTYGSVITVYNDDGEAFALKMFEDDDEEEEEEVGIGLGTLREISILRILRSHNAHPNIIEMDDVQTGFGEEEEGAGTGGCLAMAMPLFPKGSLQDCLSKITSKKQKVEIAHGILNAVAHLHENGIIHRDIKSDNILLQETEDGGLKPVLIDFSLAKVLDPQKIIPGQCIAVESYQQGETEITHTPEIGTPTYRSPEVVEQQGEYGLPSDLWSVGVVLLELLRGKELDVDKDKGAIKLVTESLDKLPQDQPFPNLIRALLKLDPEERCTARQALNSPVFQKFGLEPNSKTFSILNIKDSLPFDNDDAIIPQGKENNPTSSAKSKKKQQKIDPVLAKRYKMIQKVCHSMEWENPMTAQAALTYSIQMSELDDVDDMNNSQALLDCIILAHKFFERHLTDLEELESEGGKFEDWDIDEYVDNESTLFMMLDFCLYPRYLLDI